LDLTRRLHPIHRLGAPLGAGLLHTRSRLRGFRPRLLHELASVHPFGGALVVGGAKQPDPVDAVRPGPRESLLVLESQERSRRTPFPMLVPVRAPSAIAFPHRALDRVGDMPRGPTIVRATLRFENRVDVGPGLPPHPEPFLLHLRDEQPERPPHDDLHVPVRHRVTKQVLRLPQHVAKIAARGELDLEEVRRQRFDDARGPEWRRRSGLSMPQIRFGR